MTELNVNVDPAELGFSAARLDRIDQHFARYVDDGRLAGWQVAVQRRGRTVHHSTYGKRDLETGADWSADTIARLYSMTKCVTSVAAMMLHEEGRFQLKDPVAKFIPAFGESRVYRNGSFVAPNTDPITEPMRIWHLMTHTSGLTYGFHNSHVTDELYRRDGFEWGIPAGLTLEDCCNRWAALPLAFQPGTEWLYSVATDVLGRVVEVVSGQPLDEFLRERIFEPLGMSDTGFWVPADERDRFAELYFRNPADGKVAKMPAPKLEERPDMISGGGGLCGTASDYLRFARMLLNRGELDGERILGSRTVDYMTRNHLPGGASLEDFGRPLFAETTFDGVGFGLGFSVIDDEAAAKVPGSNGSYSWGGAASTIFWNDPFEEVTAIFLTQLLPSSTYPIRPQLQQLLSQAFVD